MFLFSRFWRSPKKGSVLVFSLIILSFLLITALSAATVVLSEKKTSSATDRSNVSFQVADSAAEQMLYEIYRGGNDNRPLRSLRFGRCDNGVFTGNVGTGTYEIVFYNNNDVQLTDCGDTTWRTGANSVTKLKATGSYGTTTRAVEVGIAPPPLPPPPIPPPPPPPAPGPPGPAPAPTPGPSPAPVPPPGPIPPGGFARNQLFRLGNPLITVPSGQNFTVRARFYAAQNLPTMSKIALHAIQGGRMIRNLANHFAWISTQNWAGRGYVEYAYEMGTYDPSAYSTPIPPGDYQLTFIIHGGQTPYPYYGAFTECNGVTPIAGSQFPQSCYVGILRVTAPVGAPDGSLWNGGSRSMYYYPPSSWAP